MSKLDERLLHFTNMGPHWFSTLLAYLPSRYGEQFRYFVNTDGKTQCAVSIYFFSLLSSTVCFCEDL